MKVLSLKDIYILKNARKKMANADSYPTWWERVRRARVQEYAPRKLSSSHIEMLQCLRNLNSPHATLLI